MINADVHLSDENKLLTVVGMEEKFLFLSLRALLCRFHVVWDLTALFGYFHFSISVALAEIEVETVKYRFCMWIKIWTCQSEGIWTTLHLGMDSFLIWKLRRFLGVGKLNFPSFRLLHLVSHSGCRKNLKTHQCRIIYAHFILMWSVQYSPHRRIILIFYGNRILR